MKIIIAHGSNDTYGASRVLIHEIICLLALGHSVHVLVPSSGPLQEEVSKLGLKATISVEPNLMVLRRSRIRDVMRTPKLPPAMQDADVVVLWTLAMVGYVPLLHCARKKFYVAVHELLPDWRARLFFGLLLRGKFPLTACSEAVARWLSSLGVQRSRIEVTYPVIDINENPPCREGAKELSEPPSGIMTVAVFGRINGHKGHLEVAKAFREPSMSGAGWRLILAGGPFPGQESALEEVLTVAEADKRISYVGELTSIHELPSSVDLVAVFPSKPEPFGLVPIEAWMAGIPSIGYGDGGAAEVLPMVGGTAVRRDGTEGSRVADALVAERRTWRNRPALPLVSDVAPKLSFENRVGRVARVLEILSK